MTLIWEANVPKVISSCEQCGSSIESYLSQKRRWCSRQCRVLGDGMPTKPKTGHYEPCGECGTDVWRQNHQKGKAAFCSVPCKNAWQSRFRVSRTCPLCGSIFDTSPSQERIYCSRACMGAAKYRRPLDRLHNGKPAVLDNYGYVRIFVPGHPAATRTGWIFEHRWVVEQALGRYLRRDENVHHVNHIRDDNRPENLQLLSHSAHSSVTGRENGEALKAAIDARQKLAEYEKRFGPLL